MAFNFSKKEFIEIDKSQDPEYLAKEAIRRIVSYYVAREIIIPGTENNYYESQEGKEQLVSPLASEISIGQASGRDMDKYPGSWLPHIFLRIPFSPMQLKYKLDSVHDIFNTRKHDIHISNWVRENYGDILHKTPKLPDLGQLAILSTTRVSKELSQNESRDGDIESYLGHMNREQQIDNWPKLITEIKKSTGREIDHFAVSDIVPQALSTLALSVWQDDVHEASRRHIELPSIGDKTLLSGCQKLGWGAYRISLGEGEDAISYFRVGVNTVEIVKP